MTTIAQIESLGRSLGALTDEEYERFADQIADADRGAYNLSFIFAEHWVKSGCQIYSVDHSLAALLAATRAPDLEPAYLPHELFLVKVPSAFLPTGNENAVTLICVASINGKLAVGLWSRTDVAEWTYTEDEKVAEERDVPAEHRRKWLLATRMVSNVVAFITAHRECVKRTTKPGAARTVNTVHPPRDVVIDRAFRDRVATLVKAGTQAEIRRALAHVVRGHWRNQPVGIGRQERRLTWVRPHRRGDSALGTVVRRTERIGDDP